MGEWARRVACVAATLSVAACGGGGDGSGDGRNPGPAPLLPSSAYAQRCAPTNTNAPAAQRTGSLDIEKQWVRSYLDEAYLWYDQSQPIDPTLPQFSDSADVVSSLRAYFRQSLTPQRTASGRYVDRFSFVVPTAEWTQRQQGTEVGYGVFWTVSYEPNTAVVLWVMPGSAAEQAGVQRGDRLQSIDNVAVSALDGSVFRSSVFPFGAGTAHRMKFMRASGDSGPDVTLAAAALSLPPVPVVKTLETPSGTVGYILFNSHDLPAEPALISAVSQLKAAGVTDLVLDLRYNEGGLIYIASELAYMIAGPERIGGRIFEKRSYNAKRSADNAQPATPFHDTSCIPDAGFTRCTSEQPLPTLGLGRVYVLATDSTCSASETIINGLRGIDVDVRIVGSATCGKPYGFNGRDNCGITYLPIEFKGVNAKGFGDYADGFGADCGAGDDTTHPLGSADEGMLAAALVYRESGVCVATASSRSMKRQVTASGHVSAAAAESALRGLRIPGPGSR